MNGASRRSALLATLVLFAPGAARAARPEPSIATERVDPATVQRYGPAYRYPRAGWIVLHVEGAPYDRGYQHGRLLAAEIADYAHTLAAKRSQAAPADAWRETRTLVNALFLRRYDTEYLEEMKGTADGASAAGATLFGRPIDLLDVVTINSDIELEFLQSALDATAIGLEGRTFREPADRPSTPAPPEHCSAFAATGPATPDGKVVIGHITMFSLTFVRHFNVWLDVKPEKGHRVLMQTYPGGIQSGMDYYLNDAGLVVLETTINQTKFDINGRALASRIRKALQYADTIDQAVSTLREGNNGMYTNEWLLADTKTNEIAMFELGTHKSKLWRSSKDEWFGGTKGFYWGCNNAKDLDVRLETVASTVGRPANLVWRPTDRDKTWLRLYAKHKGSINESFGFEAFTTPPLAASHSCDAKFTTSALAKDLKTWALFGPPLGKTWEPTDAERKRYADVRPLVGNDWTVLTADAPGERVAPVDVAAEAKGRQAALGAIEQLKLERIEQLGEVEKQRKIILALARDLDAVAPRDAVTVETFRRWSDELTRVEIMRIATKSKLDTLRNERIRSASSDETRARDAAVERAFETDPRVAMIRADLDRATRNLDVLKRVTRSAADPAVMLAARQVQELSDKKNDLRAALQPSLQNRLPAGRRANAVEQEIKDAETQLMAMSTQQEALERKLDQMRVRERERVEVSRTDPLKLKFAEKDLARADDILVAIDRRLEHLRFEAVDAAAEAEPAKQAPACLAVDLPNLSTADGSKARNAADDAHEPAVDRPPAWHGTLLPKADADVWLAAAFADYQEIVSRELAVRKKAKVNGRELRGSEKDQLAVALFAPYSTYRTAVVRSGKDVPLAETRAEVSDDEWYHIAAGKGVLLLAALRETLGDPAFLRLVDDFGREHAGKAVTTDEFVSAVGSRFRTDLKPFFHDWLTGTGLPKKPKTGFWSIDAFEAEPEKAVIVYGTLKESDAQREAAGRLQRAIEQRWSNVTVPILSDRDASTDKLKGRHVLLIGRPDTNALVSRMGKELPVTFGTGSFVLAGETYANAQTAVIAAGPRPDDSRYGVVVFAGLSAEATWKCVNAVGDREAKPAEVLVLPAVGKARRLAVSRTSPLAEIDARPVGRILTPVENRGSN